MAWHAWTGHSSVMTMQTQFCTARHSLLHPNPKPAAFTSIDCCTTPGGTAWRSVALHLVRDALAARRLVAGTGPWGGLAGAPGAGETPTHTHTLQYLHTSQRTIKNRSDERGWPGCKREGELLVPRGVQGHCAPIGAADHGQVPAHSSLQHSTAHLI